MEATSLAFTYSCQLGKAATQVDEGLIDTGAAGGNYIDTDFAERMAEIEQIELTAHSASKDQWLRWEY